METIKGYQFRIYPNKEQCSMITQIIGSYRYVYNHFLEVRTKAYNEEKKAISLNETRNMLTELKKELVWLKDADSVALQESLKDLDNAFRLFFYKQNRYPLFHSKHSPNQSYRTRSQNNNIRFEGKYIVLPKLGRVRVRQSREVDGKILNATVRKTESNKYFVSLCVQQEFEPQQNYGGEICIREATGDFYSDSRGNTVVTPESLPEVEKKIAREQKKLLKKEIGSKNYQKQQIRIGRLKDKLSNQRKDFLHNQTTMLVRENQTIYIESLSEKKTIHKRKDKVYNSSVSWSEFVRILKYKALDYGCDIHISNSVT